MKTTLRNTPLWKTQNDVRDAMIDTLRIKIMFAMQRKGYSVTQIAKLFNVNKSSVSRVLRYGVNTKSPSKAIKIR
jgi:transposase